MAQTAKYKRQWRADNPELVRAQRKRSLAKNGKKHRARSKKWRVENPAKVTDYSRNRRNPEDPVKRKSRFDRWRSKNRSRLRACRKRYRKTHRKELREKLQRRFSEDVSFRLKVRLRNRISKALNGKAKSASTMKLLGCSVESFWLYLESQFESGMTRENYGTAWEVDHILPCALFDLSKPDHQARCFHFSNLQPLTPLANKEKGAKATVRANWR